MEKVLLSGGPAALSWSLTLNGTEIGQSARLALLTGLTDMLRGAGALAPGDLNAAASPTAVLDEAAERAVFLPALKELGQRLGHVRTQLNKDLKALSRLRVQLLDRITQFYLNRAKVWGDDPAQDRQMRAGFRTYGREVLRAVGWGEALTKGLPIPATVVDDLAGAETDMVALEERLRARLTALDGYLAGCRDLPPPYLTCVPCAMRTRQHLRRSWAWGPIPCSRAMARRLRRSR